MPSNHDRKSSESLVNLPSWKARIDGLRIFERKEVDYVSVVDPHGINSQIRCAVTYDLLDFGWRHSYQTGEIPPDKVVPSLSQTVRCCERC